MDLSRDEDSSGSYGTGCSSNINIAFFIPGVIIVAVALIDMIVLFTIPTVIARNNKKKLPDAKYESPNKVIISFHFIEHIFLIALGIILIIISIGDFDTTFMIWGPTIAGILFLISYIVQLYICFKKTRSYTSQLNVEQMSQQLINKQPITFFYIYKEGTETDETCHYDSD